MRADVRVAELQAIFGPRVREGGDGEEVLVQCPHCVSRGMSKPDTSGHLGLNFDKNKGHCVRCGWGCLNLRSWLRKQGYLTAGGSLKDLGTSLRSQLQRRMTPPEPEFLDQSLKDDPTWEPILRAPPEYLKSLTEKGLTKDICKRWGIMACTSGELEGYVIFRFTELGGLVYWQGRAAWKHLLRKYSPPLTLGSSYWVFNYPDDPSSVFGRTVVVTEGTLDCISAMEVLRGTQWEDQYWAISLQGTSCSMPGPDRHRLNSQLGKILSMRPARVLLLLDPEERVKADKMAEAFREFGIRTERLAYRHGSDPNELFRSNPTYLKRLLTERVRAF